MNWRPEPGHRGWRGGGERLGWAGEQESEEMVHAGRKQIRTEVVRSVRRRHGFSLDEEEGEGNVSRVGQH